MDFSGKRLQLCRKRKGMSQKETAETIGVSLSVYNHYEHGIARPTYMTLIKLCVLFDVSADYLLGLVDEMVGYKR